MARSIVKMVYNYVFHPFQIGPMIETKVIMEEDVVKTWMGHEALVENPVLQQRKDVAIGIAEVQDKLGIVQQKTEKISSRDNKQSKAYALTYYNPVTDKTEVLVTKTDSETHDFVQQMIEEASSKESAYAMYSFIAAPIIMKQVDPILLQRILDDREYGTPPSFGGGAAIKISQTGVMIPIQIKAEQARGAVIEALRRKEIVEKKVDREIILLKEAVDALRRKQTPEEALRKLGPLTRVRLLAFLRERKLSVAIMILLMEKDIGFLQSIKKKLQLLATGDLIDLIRAMKKLREKK